MIHKRYYINTFEGVGLNATDWVVGKIESMTSVLEDEGYRVFSNIIGDVIEDYFGEYIDHEDIVQEGSFGRRGRPPAYVHLAKKNNTFVFYDVDVIGAEENRESDKMGNCAYELDIFAESIDEVKETRDEIIEVYMKKFGVTKEKSEIVKDQGGLMEKVKSIAEDELTEKESISHDLYDKLKSKKDRKILIELRKRGSVLESDLGDLSSGQASSDEIKNTLNYFSGDEYQLINRKMAIVCRDTDEIVFLMDDKEKAKEVGDLECPKCTGKIEDEKIISYYGRNDKLDDLLDGSRWMPLHVKGKFLENGVPESSVFTEVKYEQDEIDVVVFLEGYTLIIEVKDRPVNLNDAYKLSAKTTRLESIFEESLTQQSSFVSRQQFPGITDQIDFVPIIISTGDIADDATDLLEETKSNAMYLENCEGEIETFVEKLVRKINHENSVDRLDSLVSGGQKDSISNFISEVVQESILQISK